MMNLLTWDKENRERCVLLAQYLLQNRTTIRAAAKEFGISKSTVHKDVTVKLPKIDRVLAQKTKRLLDCNKAERHLRGGEATRRKYETEKQHETDHKRETGKKPTAKKRSKG